MGTTEETYLYDLPERDDGGSYSNVRSELVGSGTELRVTVDVTVPDPPPPQPAQPPYVSALLARPNKRAMGGTYADKTTINAPGDRFTLDARGGLWKYQRSFGASAPIGIGKGSRAADPAVVGASVIAERSQIPWDAEWQWVKTNCDSASVRIEGAGTLYGYDLAFRNLEDGFEPHPAAAGSSFSLERFYMEHIRDDAVENDQGMSGTIRDGYVELCNRFLSEQLDSQGLHAPNSMVTIEDVLLHMGPMPNARAKDGQGYGGVFKWMGDAGKVTFRDSVVLLDEPPIADNAWPAGSYENVTVVLGPKHPSGTPGYLPRTGVKVTRDMTVWTKAVEAWLGSHRDLVDLPTG